MLLPAHVQRVLLETAEKAKAFTAKSAKDAKVTGPLSVAAFALANGQGLIAKWLLF